MKKKLLSLVVGAMLFAPTLSSAVGLGSVRTYSHLNERLRAEIPVLSVKKKGRMTVSLASNAEFAQRGVPRSDILGDIKFSLVKRGGRTYISVSSKKQIAAPYLNFILRLNTPEGVVSREYAIFLDPSNRGTKSAPASRKPVAQSYTKQKKATYRKPQATRRTHATKRPRRNVAERSQRAKVRRPARPSNRVSGLTIANMAGTKYGPVRNGETLWTIAAHVRPSTRVSVGAMARAIQRANPKSMPGGKLYSGFVINIPTIKGYSAYSGGFAPMPEGLEANENPEANAVREPKAQEQQAQIVPPGMGSSVADKSPVDNTPKEALPSQVAPATKAEVTQAPVPKAENTSEMANTPAVAPENMPNEASNGVAKVDANKTGGEENKPSGVGTAPVPVAPPVEESKPENAPASIAKVETDSVNADGGNDSGVSSEVGKPVEPSVVQASPADNVAQESAPENVPVAEEQTTGREAELPEVVAEPQKTEPKEESKPVVIKKAAPTPPPPEPSLMDTVMENLPLIGGGSLAGLAVIGGAVVALRKRRRKDDVEVITEDDVGDFEDNIDELDDDMDGFADDSLDDIDDADLDAFDDSELDDFDDTDLDAFDDSSLDDFDEAGLDDFSDSDLDDATDELEDSVADITSDDDFSAEDDIDLFASDDDDESFDTIEDSDSDLEFNFDEPAQEPEEDLSFDLGDTTEEDNSLSFDFSDDTDTDTEEPASLTEEVDADDDFDDLDFSLDALTESMPKEEETSSDELDDLDLSFDLSNDLDEEPPEVDTEDSLLGLSAEPVGIEDKEISADIVSSMQMKLDLANSFMSIGQDSRAKHLLEEIIGNGNKEQVASAKELLKNLG